MKFEGMTFNKNIVKVNYSYFRNKGFMAPQAYYFAKVKALWDVYEPLGVIQFRVVPDELEYDDSYIDTWGFSKRAAKYQKEKLWKKIEQEGVWRILTEIRCPYCLSWTHVDSIGGFIGEDYNDSGYDWEVKAAAVEAVLHMEQKP